MEYISAEEFLKQPKEVQKVFLDWWKPKFGDLASFKGISKHCLGTKEDYCFVNEYNEEREQDQYEDSYGIELYNMFCIGNDFSKYGFSFKSKFDVIPLLSEGQLRQFIEDKTISSMSCRFEKYENMFITDAHYIVLYDLITHKPKNTYESEKTKRVDAYWEVALQIAKEKVKA